MMDWSGLLLYVVMECVFVSTLDAFLNGRIFPQTLHSDLAILGKHIVGTNFNSRTYDFFVVLVKC